MQTKIAHPRESFEYLRLTEKNWHTFQSSLDCQKLKFLFLSSLFPRHDSNYRQEILPVLYKTL